MPGSFDVHDALILTLRANGDVLFDRRTVQRLLYFESLKLQSLKAITYCNNFYGPFSHEVESVLDDLVALSYMGEYIQSIYDLESHRYELILGQTRDFRQLVLYSYCTILIFSLSRLR